VVPRFVEPRLDVGTASTRVLFRGRLNVVAVLAVGGGGGGGGDDNEEDSGWELLVIFWPGANWERTSVMCYVGISSS